MEDPNVRKDATGWLVICAFAIILAVIFAIIIYLLYQDIRAPDAIQRCNVGMCKFSIITGVKTCPEASSTVGIRVFPGAEFCTSRNYCQHPGYTCAVQADQSVRCDGICDTAECKCVHPPLQ